jgi:hypothetical protein
MEDQVKLHLDKTPSMILKELAKNPNIENLPTLKSLQWKVRAFRKKAGLSSVSTIEGVTNFLTELKLENGDSFIYFAERIVSPCDDLCFSIGFTSTKMLSILISIEEQRFWNKVLLY